MRFRFLLLLLAVCLLAPLAFAQTDLSVEKSGPVEAAGGTNVTYTVTLRNLGEVPALTVLLTDPLPPGMTFVSQANDGGFSCTTPAVGDGGTINCTSASLAAGATVTFTIVAQLPDVPSGTTFDNSATVSTQTIDDNEENDTGSTSLVVAAESDLFVEKSGPAETAAGSNVTYTVTLTNFGPDEALSVLLVDPLPPGMTFVSQSNDGGFSCDTPAVGDGGTIDCTAPSLAAGATVTFTIVAQLPPDAPPGTTFINSATASTETIDVNDENDTGSTSTSTPQPQQADLSVMKTGPDASGPDTDVSFTIVVTNNGPGAAIDVLLEDVLPGGVTFVSLTNSNPTGLPCTTPPTNSGGTVSCSTASFAPGASATLILTVHLPETTPATYTNTAVVSSANDPNEENDVSTTTLTVTSVDISVDKSGPPVATAGSNISYTLTVTNAGPDTALDVELSDPLPPGTAFVSLDYVSGPIASCTTAGGNVVCTYGILGPASPSVYTLTLAIGNATTITNTASVLTSSFDTDGSNDSDSVVTTVTQSADLAVTKTATPAAVAGTNVTFNVSVTNSGPSNAVNVSLTDALPPNSTFVSATQNSGPPFTCGHAAGTITCTIATFNAGATATFTFVATANPGATGSLTNSATIASTTPDPNGGNNTSATTTTTLTSSADVSVTKSAPIAVVTGSNVTFAITVTNAGPSTAVNVSLTDVLAPTLTFVSMTQTAGPAFTCGQAAGTVTCTIAALAPAVATFDLVATTTVEGPISNTANVASTTPDPAAGNNTSTTSTNVTRQVADLSIAKTANATEFVPGSPAVFTIVVTNNGPGPAENVVVTDTIPAGTTLLSVTPTQGTCSGSPVVTCNLGTLAALATATITLEVRLPLTPGPVVNTATVTSTDADTSPANNASTATITVTAAPAGIPTLSPLMMLMLALSLGVVVILRTR